MANEQNLRAGNPGNKGGTGRPPSELRRAMREILETHGVAKLEKIVSGEEDGVSPSESLKGIEICGKFGLGEAKQVASDELIKAFAEVLADDENINVEWIEPMVQKMIDKLKEL